MKRPQFLLGDHFRRTFRIILLTQLLKLTVIIHHGSKPQDQSKQSQYTPEHSGGGGSISRFGIKGPVVGIAIGFPGSGNTTDPSTPIEKFTQLGDFCRVSEVSGWFKSFLEIRI